MMKCHIQPLGGLRVLLLTLCAVALIVPFFARAASSPVSVQGATVAVEDFGTAGDGAHIGSA